MLDEAPNQFFPTRAALGMGGGARSKFTAVLLSAAMAAALSSMSALGGAELQPTPQQLYGELLAVFPEDRQGYGKDWFMQVVDHQPMTYGLVLSAEAIHLQRAPGEESRRRVKKAARWLMDNRDLDGDGWPGWGIPQPWDAWSDGTTNAPNQPYTITTAIVLDGLLDAMDARSLWSANEIQEMRALAIEVVMRWCRKLWSNGYGGGFFWYSPSRNDEIFGVNAPAMFLSGMIRLSRDHKQALRPDQLALIQSRADQLARAIVSTVELRDGQPFWLYAPLPNKANNRRPNDLLHHCYTLWGIERYRDCGGRVPLPWTREGAIRSAERFWREGKLCEYTEKDSPGQSPAPARLWSAGMMLACCAQFGDTAGAGACLRAIQENYGPWPQLRTDPKAGPDKAFPRDSAHVLIGLALHAFPNRTSDSAR